MQKTFSELDIHSTLNHTPCPTSMIAPFPNDLCPSMPTSMSALLNSDTLVVAFVLSSSNPVGPPLECRSHSPCLMECHVRVEEGGNQLFSGGGETCEGSGEEVEVNKPLEGDGWGRGRNGHLH